VKGVSEKMYVLNTPLLTNWGTFLYGQITIEQAKKLLQKPFTSAIGHEGTATLLSKLLGIEIPVNRVAIKMQPGDRAVVFQVLQRLPEGAVLTEEELRKIPYSLGLLQMLSPFT
jgi:hypothetical protein